LHVAGGSGLGEEKAGTCNVPLPGRGRSSGGGGPAFACRGGVGGGRLGWAWGRQVSVFSGQRSAGESGGGAAAVPGVFLEGGENNCAACNRAVARERITELARVGRQISHSPEAEARRSESQRRQAAALKAWNPAEQPDWLTATVYREKIQPRLVEITVPAISSALGVSGPYAGAIRAGRRLPHPRHWKTLARLVELSAP
jgi:hypothetical protein